MLNKQSAIIWALKSFLCMCVYPNSVLGFPAHSWCITAPRLHIPCCCWIGCCGGSGAPYQPVKCEWPYSPSHICTHLDFHCDRLLYLFSLKISRFVFPGNTLVLSAWCFTLLAGMVFCNCLGDFVVVFDLLSSSTRLPNVSKILFVIILYPSPKCHLLF